MELANKSDIKILLVEGRENNLFSIQTELAKDGYQFKKAASGKEAVNFLLKEGDFTLILVDVGISEQNGFETASHINEQDWLRHIPVVFVSASGYCEEELVKGYKVGVVDYIFKPVNPELLRAKVSVLVNLYRKNHQLINHEMQLQKVNALEKVEKEHVAEKNRNNKELDEVKAELKKVNKDLDNFVYSASHDLKAPMSNIEGLLSTLYETLGETIVRDENVQLIFELINKSIGRFKSTITELTEITKIQRNLEEDFNSIIIEQAIKDVLLSIHGLIETSGAKITVNSDPNIKLDFSRKNLNSILFNLITNSIKYRSPERKPEISIDIKKYPDCIVLTIEDNGLGFNPADKEKIFGMFKRLHNHVEGSGIGLYIVKRILENCGGNIDADSKQGKGSIFKVKFSLSTDTAREKDLAFKDVR